MTLCNKELEENKLSNTGRFLKVKSGCKLFVRLIGQPVRMVKVVSHDRRHAIIESEDVGRLLRDKYPHKLSRVYVRYACWCFDRIDNSLKILDMPVFVAKAFHSRQENVGKKIADISEGCDWAIKTNGKKGMSVRYDVVFIDESPLSNSEMQMVRDQKSGQNGPFDLMQIFKSCGFKEAEAILFGV